MHITIREEKKTNAEERVGRKEKTIFVGVFKSGVRRNGRTEELSSHLIHDKLSPYFISHTCPALCFRVCLFDTLRFPINLSMTRSFRLLG